MKNKFYKEDKGITLIALVITIIVLLILAGVAISMLSGENGILTQAANAKTKYGEAQENEFKELAQLEWDIESITNDRNLKMREGIVTVQPDNTLANIKNQIPDGYKIENSENEAITDETKILTGMKVIKDNTIVGIVAVLGDVNKDGYIDSEDASVIQDIVEGNSDIEEDYLKEAMDVNNDGIISDLDAELILKYEIGEITEFPNEGNTKGISSIVVEKSE